MASNGKWVNPRPHLADPETGLAFQSLSAYLGGIQPFVPVLTASTTDPTLGTGGEAHGEYIITGPICYYWGMILFGSAGFTAGSGTYRISLPVPGRATYAPSGVSASRLTVPGSSIRYSMGTHNNVAAQAVTSISFPGYYINFGITYQSTILTGISSITATTGGGPGAGDLFLWSMWYFVDTNA